MIMLSSSMSCMWQRKICQVQQKLPKEGKGPQELGWEVVQRAQAGCTGITGHPEATAPEGVESYHNDNNTLHMNWALHLTKMLLLSKVILVVTSIFER